MHVCVYLFVVYFSFAPIISACIDCYVNYFDMQVLMMVTETETLTSTLYHNIFTDLDYVYSATFIDKIDRYVSFSASIYPRLFWFFNRFYLSQIK